MPPSASPANRAPALKGRTSPRKPKRERRRGPRFPIRLPVRYSIAQNSGWGLILNIGSGGALFTISQPMAPGDLARLCIGWPVLLHEKVHLNLVAKGVIVRVEDCRAAVRFDKYEFRTSSSTFRRRAALKLFYKNKSPRA